MLGLTEKLVDDRALVVGNLAENGRDGQDGLSFNVKELPLVRIHEGLKLGCCLLFLLLGSLGLLGWLLESLSHFIVHRIKFL